MTTIIDNSNGIAMIICQVIQTKDNVQRSHDYKEEKYAPLVADLSRDFKVYNYSVEISARS